MKKLFLAFMALAAIALVGCKDKNEPINGGEANSDYSLPDNVVAVDLGLPSGTKWANMNFGATNGNDAASWYASVWFWEYTANTITAEWGPKWQMPTKDQVNELLTAKSCVWSDWITNYKGIKGLNGYIITNKNDPTKHIFLPAGGRNSNNDGTGNYWTFTLIPSMLYEAYYLHFDKNTKEFWSTLDERLSIRPVLNK